MRLAPSLLVLALASQAHADTGASFDVGYVRNRVAVTDQTSLPGELARFGIKISVGQHIHFGAEAEEGRVSGQSSLPDGSVARTSEQVEEPAGPLEGNTLGLKAFAGAHTNVGAFIFGADVAAGMRDTWVSGDLGMDVAGRKNEPLLELRSRADFRLTQSTTLGAAIATDLFEPKDISVAAIFALHFTR